MDNCTVYLEDNGQDFLEFDIVDNKIDACRPMQGWLWVGREVVSIILGKLTLRIDGKEWALNHKVIMITEYEPKTETENEDDNPKQN